jgi:hypothetical protein
MASVSRELSSSVVSFWSSLRRITLALSFTSTLSISFSIFRKNLDSGKADLEEKNWELVLGIVSGNNCQGNLVTCHHYLGTFYYVSYY